MSNSTEPVEAEIINPGGNSQTPKDYKAKYNDYSEKTRQASPTVFIISVLAFFLSLIPVLGVSLAIIAMILAKIKNTGMLLASIAFVIGCISTTLFLLLAMVLRWIF